MLICETLCHPISPVINNKSFKIIFTYTCKSSEQFGRFSKQNAEEIKRNVPHKYKVSESE